ncbi:amino acid ABC transporter substrate-binding protein [Marinobacter salinus]|uniref:Amino acid ABC transporter substrate-binding protein n=2 Tax=Marinobacter salinus TaxID=1874317 RepID=A0A1D9GRP6_9GAMM|nr:amino acid ABC transporter substrate-binding protein [Marinobacter salinus]
MPSAYPETKVRIGIYHFPPVAGVGPDNQPTGLLGDLLRELRKVHNDVSFQVFYTSPKRRYLDYEAGLYDVIFFQSANWGWSGRDVTISRPILTDEELYVALKKPGRNLSFFDDIASHAIVAMSGYHYGFADLEVDSQKLQQKFNVEFSDSHNRNLQLIMADRPSVAEVAVISHSYLQMHLSKHPDDRSKLLISDKPDQQYELRIIARKNGPVSATDMMELLAPLIHNGSYQKMVEDWGLHLPPEFLNGFQSL